MTTMEVSPKGAGGRMRAAVRSRFVTLGVGLLAQIAVVVAFLLAWQWGTDAGYLSEFFFSRPSDVGTTLNTWATDGTLWQNTSSTLYVLLLGWTIGIVAGTGLGILIGVSQIARDLLEPFVVFFNAVPRLLFVPFFMLWFGFGTTPKVLLVVVVIIFLVALTVAAGMREVSQDLVDNVRIMGAGRLGVIRQVYLPSVALWILATSRTTVGYAFQAAVTAEFLGSTVGLGFLVVQAQTFLSVQEIFAALCIMFVIGILLDQVLGLVESRITRWMP